MAKKGTNSTSHRESAAYRAAKRSDQKSIEVLRNFWREEAMSPLNNGGDTILHFLAVHGNATALKLLSEERPFSSEDLRTKNNNGNTALHEAARFGQKEIVEIMLNLDSGLVSERNSKGETPIYVAAMNGEKGAFTPLTDKLFSDEFTMIRNDGSTVLHAAVTHECYYFALHLLKIYPELARKRDGEGIPAEYEESKPNNNLEDPETTTDVLVKKRSSFVNFLLDNFTWLGVIDDEKQKHILALTLAKRLIRAEDWSFNANCVKNPLIEATKLGINELVVEIIQNYPQTVETVDEDGNNILHIAVERKNRLLFDLFLKEASHKDRLLTDTNLQGKTIMHFATNVGSPFNFSTGEPAEKIMGYKTLILMAWGVLWFKRVKHCVHPRLWTVKDNDGKTANELFDKKHSEVCKEAQRYIKDLAGAALILSTLLCTINFAAVFTVPGGFNEKTGIPILLYREHSDLWMLMFFLGAALYDSVFTMGTLVSILLSKFDSDDFYICLPVKFCIVIISVYYATAFTVLGCVQALNVENIFKNKDVWWLIFLLLFLGWYMTLIVLDVCYFVFDYVYYFIRYSVLYKRNKHVL
ncbi:protein ACCELERATED CELL DEATH 6-like isoform X2 [Lycium ferocissimum]|uniref:protein ACCELERATED CELL DEATH 6-like isoform X2 n=1 Tax=Lycium ferocissimum TaxID=112874 RepID=UPI00281555FE|nr:protein ACCELERATED CELL DEATH 6-like isoform X2 [Lycium ferocissimum]